MHNHIYPACKTRCCHLCKRTSTFFLLLCNERNKVLYLSVITTSTVLSSKKRKSRKIRFERTRYTSARTYMSSTQFKKSLNDHSNEATKKQVLTLSSFRFFFRFATNDHYSHFNVNLRRVKKRTKKRTKNAPKRHAIERREKQELPFFL